MCLYTSIIRVYYAYVYMCVYIYTFFFSKFEQRTTTSRVTSNERATTCVLIVVNNNSTILLVLVLACIFVNELRTLTTWLTPTSRLRLDGDYQRTFLSLRMCIVFCETRFKPD